jgi:subtilisin family serine protease
VTPAPDVLPVVSVGALNPNLSSDALFSNTGPWVCAYAEGAAVLSTMPVTFQGGLQAQAATKAFGRTRSSIDPDDFSGGFAVWSGTSFAAPLLAGRLAERLRPHLVDGDTADKAYARAMAAVHTLTTIAP